MIEYGALHRHDFPYPARSSYHHCIYGPEVNLAKARLHEALNVELQVEPKTLPYHVARDPGVQRLLYYVVPCVGISRPC